MCYNNSQILSQATAEIAVIEENHKQIEKAVLTKKVATNFLEK